MLYELKRIYYPLFKKLYIPLIYIFNNKMEAYNKKEAVEQTKPSDKFFFFEK